MGAVAKKKSAELSTDVMDDILEFAGEGATYDSSEMQIPFIRILQAMSPQLKKREAQYIEGSDEDAEELKEEAHELRGKLIEFLIMSFDKVIIKQFNIIL